MAKKISLFETFEKYRNSDIKTQEESIRREYQNYLEEGFESNVNFKNISKFKNELGGRGLKTDGYLTGEVKLSNKTWKSFAFLLETKAERGFSIDTEKGEEHRDNRIRALCQVVYYLHNMYVNDTLIVPAVAMIGDFSSCFVLPTEYILENYLKRDYGWSEGKSPSSAYKKGIDGDAKLFEDLKNDINAVKWVEDVKTVNADFSVDNDIIPLIHKFIENSDYKVKVDAGNIYTVFDTFRDIFTFEDEKDEKNKSTGKKLLFEKNGDILTGRDICDVFMTMLNSSENEFEDNYGAKSNGYVQFGLKQVGFGVKTPYLIKADKHRYNCFVNTYKVCGYNLRKIDNLNSIRDRLIEDSDRRSKGDFYTPTIWAKESHKMIAEQLGEDWTEKYLVWDCCCGTKNLTRDISTFKLLYSSTLKQGDIDLSRKYNLDKSHCLPFVYNFLEDDVEEFEILLERKKQGHQLVLEDFKFFKKYENQLNGDSLKIISQGWDSLVKNLLDKKPILFFINPPYGTGSTQKTRDGSQTDREDTETPIKKLMMNNKDYKLGECAPQMYAQFVYRIGLIKELFDLPECHIALYSKSAIQGSPKFEGLRQWMGKHWKLVDAMMFPASEFSDCSDSWGIFFSIWRSDVTPEPVKDIDTKIMKLRANQIQLLDIKRLYNLDGQQNANDWMKEGALMPKKSEDGKDGLWIKDFELKPQLTSAVKIVQDGKCLTHKDSLGYFVSSNNNVYKNSQDVYIVSSGAPFQHGANVLDKNFDKVVTLFTARKLITGKYHTFYNDKDEYLVPNVEHDLWKKYVANSIVYSIFNTSSQQSSLRNVEFGNKNDWNIFNEWFFMSYKDIENIVVEEDSDIYNSIIKDIDNHGKERYVYNKLLEVEDLLTDEAKEILRIAKEIVIKSLPYRSDFGDWYESHTDTENWHINTWDAGWKQISALLKFMKKYYSNKCEDILELQKKMNDIYIGKFSEELREMMYAVGFLKK